MRAIVPERFGCGMKVSFAELAAARARVNEVSPGHVFADYAIHQVRGIDVARSIDKIFSVDQSPEIYCRLAYLHASADILCAGAVADVVDICFEFGLDEDAVSRSNISSAAFSVAQELGLRVGKCHSTYSATTALTVAVQGPVRVSIPSLSQEGATDGWVLLTRPLGGLKELYLNAIGNPSDLYPAALSEMLRRQDELILRGASLVTWVSDVSGFGLAGALIEAHESTGADFLLQNGHHLWMGGSEQAASLPCLGADLGNATDQWGLGEEELTALSTRELCGPLLILCTDACYSRFESLMNDLDFTPVVVGRFKKSQLRRGRIQWK